MRRAILRDSCGGVIDHGLCVYFPGPGSFTGEDTLELHIHGSSAVAKKLGDELLAFDGVRAAEAGEFTKRAFLNGKLDLAEAEGLSDLLVAETEAQRRLALAQSDGRLSAVYADWRMRLVHCRAMIEATIDFAEEDDVKVDVFETIFSDIRGLRTDIQAWLLRSANSEIVRDGFKVAIIGAPNAGKSSLLNALAGRDAAIVSDEPGTTRDLIDARLELGGNLVIVTDTAGIRESVGKVEAIGIKKAIGYAGMAHLVILLEDASAPVSIDAGLGGSRIFRVGNKSDLGVVFPDRYDFVISAMTGAGLDVLVSAISDLANDAGGNSELLILQQRQKDLLGQCCQALDCCFDSGHNAELAAEHLRQASNSIGRLTGAVDVEELLGVIFSRFCIGK
jgi:tRNA modification GTPase